jgi:cytoskeleton protein RodZ
LSLEDAGDATGIHPYHVDAIEFGDMTHMPPRLEALEMIAGYAQFLGFDPDPLIEHMLAFLPPPPVARKAFHPASPPPLSSAKILAFGKMPKLPQLNIRIANYPGGTGGIVASLFAAFFLFAGTSWLMTPSTEPAAVEQQTAQVGDPMPTASTGPEAADIKVTETPMPGVDASAANDPSLQVVPNAGSPSGEDPDALGAFIEDQTTESKPVGKSKKIMQTAAAEVPQPDAGHIYGAGNEGARVVLKATAPVWLRIEDAAGNVVMTQMLNTGDIYRVPNRDGLIALSRDGGRLSYVLDGQEKGLLGPPGKILVGEKLDISALQARN